MNLPKDYLSWSAYELWHKNKPEFRRRYYENKQPQYISREMMFGSEIGKLLEHNDTSVAHIPRGTHPEYRIRTTLADVPVLCYLDSFTPDTKTIIEYKTSRVGWTQKRVDTHGQLLMYASAVRKEFGEYDPTVTLVWMETRKVPITKYVMGYAMQEDDIELTGHVETFTRTIADSDLDVFEAVLADTAYIISKDYDLWMNSRSASETT